MNMEPKVYNRFNRPPTKKEKGGGEVLVDKAGYVSGQKRIEAIMNAGMNLRESRREEYDSSDGSEPELDPTRNPGFDLADGSSMFRSLRNRLKARKERMDADKRREAEQAQKQLEEDATKFQEGNQPGRNDKDK